MGSYIPSTASQRQEMLKAIGLETFRQLYKDVPAEMYLDRELNIPSGMSELEVSRAVSEMASDHQYGLEPRMGLALDVLGRDSSSGSLPAVGFLHP